MQTDERPRSYSDTVLRVQQGRLDRRDGTHNEVAIRQEERCLEQQTGS